MLTLIMPYYRNPGMLELQYATWAQWPAKVRAQFDVVIVDDGSPEPAIDVPRPDGLPTLSIYRVTEDRPWHQHAARNLGAHVAKGPWLLLTDMDHVLTPDNASALFRRLRLLNDHTAYFLHRIEADTGLPTRNHDGRPKPHPNSFVMTRDLYWLAGGYDEDFCGIYGTDGLFKTRLFEVAERSFLKRVALTRYWRDIVPDASTNAPRKEGRRAGAKEAAVAAKAARGETGTVKTLAFPWERVL